VGVRISEAAGEGGLGRLHPEERAHLEALGPARRGAFAAGRVALRLALGEIGLAAEAPLFWTPRGAPALPPGAAGSLSHKDDLALALVAARRTEDPPFHLGVDLERREPGRIDVSGRVLTPAEHETLAAFPEPQRRSRVRLHFSLKESIYKAIDPFLGRFVSWSEVGVFPEDNGRVRVECGLGPYVIEATYGELTGYWLTTSRVTMSVAGRI
jgi:4'-phosphopantetheinyl transferase EntD